MKRLIFLCLVSILSFSCEKTNTGDDISSESDLTLNMVHRVIVTRDNGLLIAGVHESKVVFIKTDANFNVTWRKDDYEWGKLKEGSWGTSLYIFKILNLFEKDNGNFVCAGSIMQGGCVVTQSIMMIEVDEEGREIRKELISDHYIIDVIETSDGGYLLSTGDILKLDKDFSIEWEKDLPYGEPWIGSVISTSDGRYAMTAWNSDDHNLFIKIMEEGGNESMSSEFSYNEINNEETGFDLFELDEGGFMIAGRSRTCDEPWDMDYGIIRVDRSGNSVWSKSFGTGRDEWLDEFIYHSADEIIIQGSIGYPADPVLKTLLIKIDTDGQITDSLTIDKIDPLVYHPNHYFIKYEGEEEESFHFEKIPFSELFR